MEGVLQQIYAYPRWPEVLAELNLVPAKVDYKELVLQATRMGGGEGEEHRRLKEHVSRNPQLVKVSKRSAPGEMERCLPSGDAIDVFFESKQEWIGVEVKPATSDIADITRGLFQCVKYQAVLCAMAVVLQKHIGTRTVLVLGGRLPSELEVLRTMLGIDVVEGAASPRRSQAVRPPAIAPGLPGTYAPLRQREERSSN